MQHIKRSSDQDFHDWSLEEKKNIGRSMKSSSPFSGSSGSKGKELVGTASSSSRSIVLPCENKEEEELEWKRGLPPGVKFVPSQEEFIYYLLKKVCTGRIDFGGVIRDIDLYKYEPEDLKALAFEGESRLYFFTPLRKRYTNGERTKRETVHGCWKGTQRTRTIKVSDNKPIITRTPFCYYRSRGKTAKKTQWLMDEYRLINQDNHHIMLENWALCVVHYKKRGEKGNNEEEGGDKRNETDKSNSSTDSRSTAVGSSPPNSMIGSSSESCLTISSEKGNSCQTPTSSKHNPYISFGYNNFNVGSFCSYPQPTQSLIYRQQCSTSYDQSLLTCPNYDQYPSSHAEFPKRRSPSSNGTPNFDQTQLHAPFLADNLNPNFSNLNHLSINNNIIADQMLSDFNFDDPMFKDLYTILHDDCLDPSPHFPSRKMIASEIITSAEMLTNEASRGRTGDSNATTT